MGTNCAPVVRGNNQKHLPGQKKGQSEFVKGNYNN